MNAKTRKIRLSNGMPHQARKRFGQNFLHDEQVIARIVDAIDPKPDQHLLEIGPGQGAITDLLAQAGGPLDCVELDRDLADFLEKGLPGMTTSPSISRTFSSLTWLL